jgi:hypothetical protein
VSSLNWAPQQTTSNAVTVKLGTAGAAGRIELYNEVGTVHVLLDTAGYYR